MASFLGDPRRTAVLAVSTAEEMPVTETLELRARLREELGLEPGARSSSTRSSRIGSPAPTSGRCGPRRRLLRGTPPCSAATWARHQRKQIARLRRGLRGVPLVTLPLVFDSALGPAALEQLSREFER